MIGNWNITSLARKEHELFIIYFILWQTTTGESLECYLPVPVAIPHVN